MKILLTGDSWAAGDWNAAHNWEQDSADPVLKKLLEQDGYTVILQSYPSQSDLPSINSVKQNIDSVDCVIFFKTQSSRLINKETNIEFYNFSRGSDWPTYKDYKENNFQDINIHIVDEMKRFGFYSYENLLLEYAQQNLNLNEIFYKISKQIVFDELKPYTNKIILVGGIEDIDTEYKFKYCVKSLIEILTGHQQNNYTLSSAEEFVGFYKIISESNLSLEQKNSLLNELLRMYDDSKTITALFIKNQDYFGPNDFLHPNSTAIQYYYQEYIKPELEEIKNDYRTAV